MLRISAMPYNTSQGYEGNVAAPRIKISPQDAGKGKRSIQVDYPGPHKPQWAIPREALELCRA
jgi:hypothetical protein